MAGTRGVADSINESRCLKDILQNSQGKVKNKSKRKGPIFGLSYYLPLIATIILKELGESRHQAEIADHLKKSKQMVNYWTLKYLEQGLIREESIGKPKTYSLTALGQEILTRSDRSCPQPCMMEDYPAKFELVCDRSRIEWEKLGEPRNWKKLGVLVGNVRVEKTSRSIIIHTGQLSGFNPHHLLFEAGQIVSIVRAVLQDRGVELGSYSVPLHSPIFKNYTETAAVLNHLYGTVGTKDGSIDASPPDCIPHEEYKGVETAFDYLAMPSRVKELVQSQNRQEERLCRMEQLVGRFVTAIEKLSAPVDSAALRPLPRDRSVV
jgi:hypothetical protein